VTSYQKLPVEKWIREGSYFFLLTSSSLARRLVTPKFKRRGSLGEDGWLSSPPHFTLRSNRFSFRSLERVKCQM
jgi:hypothetical protein